MRRLLYVPIIHGDEDLGSAGATLAQQSARLSGERRWAMHKETAGAFWERVGDFLLSVDSPRLKVYQDGLPADGEIGRRIVEAAAGMGSKNYELVLELLNRGAELCKTEDPVLLLQEHQNIVGFMHQELVEGEQRDAEQYQLERDRLMEKRDTFIAETISTTLKEGEVGVLLIGAQHNVVPRLAADISLEAVRDPDQVRAYFNELFLGHDDKRFEELAQYLSSPVSVP